MDTPQPEYDDWYGREPEAKPMNTEAKLKKDPLMDLARSIERAWAKYTAFFGEPPHGTFKQIAAMLELMPDKTALSLPATPDPLSEARDAVLEAALVEALTAALELAGECSNLHDGESGGCEFCEWVKMARAALSLPTSAGAGERG